MSYLQTARWSSIIVMKVETLLRRQILMGHQEILREFATQAEIYLE